MTKSMSRDRVLEAALGLVDRDGLAKLSMRSLGRELGVEAMTLYYYVPNKDAVLDGLVERVISQVRPEPGPGLAWVADYARSLRRVLLQHPRVVPLLAGRPLSTPGGLELLESVVTALGAAGLSPNRAMHLVNAVATFTIGHTLAEIPGDRETPLPDLAAFPGIRAAIDGGLGTPADHEARFELALTALVAGMTG